MKRREMLKGLVVATAAAAMLPSCVFDKKKKEASVAFKNIPVSGDQEETLAAVADTLIPETDIVGAKSLKAHLFVLTMVNDCYNTEARDSFMKGFDALDKFTDKKFNKSFLECDAKQREEILTAIDKAGESLDSKDLKEFYAITKRHTVQAFMSSEYVMKNIEGYEYLPGRFHGCVDLAKQKVAA